MPALLPDSQLSSRQFHKYPNLSFYAFIPSFISAVGQTAWTRPDIHQISEFLESFIIVMCCNDISVLC